MAPRAWHAPAGTFAPESDPPPTGRGAGSWTANAPSDWRRRAAGAIERLGMPVLTTVDADGWPIPLRARAAESTADGFDVVLPAGVEIVDGPAFLSFHTHREVFDGQENIGLAGHARADGGVGACDRRTGPRRLRRVPQRGPLGHRDDARRLRPAAAVDERGRPPRRQPADLRRPRLRPNGALNEAVSRRDRQSARPSVGENGAGDGLDVARGIGAEPPVEDVGGQRHRAEDAVDLLPVAALGGGMVADDGEQIEAVVDPADAEQAVGLDLDAEQQVAGERRVERPGPDRRGSPSRPARPRRAGPAPAPG